MKLLSDSIDKSSNSLDSSCPKEKIYFSCPENIKSTPTKSCPLVVKSVPTFVVLTSSSISLFS